MVDVHFSNDKSFFFQDIPAVEEGIVLVLSGEGKFSLNKTIIKTGQIGHFSKTNLSAGPIRLIVNSIRGPMRFILWSGQPLHQPVVAHGTFVMNTKEQIVEAFADYRAGVFGQIPPETLDI